MRMPGRIWDGIGYRFGFNGKENDNEAKGTGNEQDYGMRIYDPRLGRFLSVDPIRRQYPQLTPFQFASNSPIAFIDLDGNEGELYLLKLIQHLVGKMDEKADKIKEKNTKTTAEKTMLFINGISKSTPFGAAHQISKQLNKLSNSTPEQKKEFVEQNKAHLAKMSLSILNDLMTGQPMGLTIIKDELIGPVFQKAFEGDPEAIGEIVGSLGQLGTTRLFGGEIPNTPVLSETNLPTRLVRVVPADIHIETLGRSGAKDVFVADASELTGITNSEQLARKLTLLDNRGNYIKGPFRLIEFDTPISGLAQPIRRSNPGFLPGGKTAGDATDYVIPNANLDVLRNVSQKVIN